jgi:uncharacterized protein GlcG (DUF336 family)
MLSELA